MILGVSASSDSDRGPSMRGVDGRGGGYPGDGANPPSGGRGRGMVLPAWMTNQQNQQTPQVGGPVSSLPQHAPCAGCVSFAAAVVRKNSNLFCDEVRSSLPNGRSRFASFLRLFPSAIKSLLVLFTAVCFSTVGKDASTLGGCRAENRGEVMQCFWCPLRRASEYLTAWVPGGAS